MKGTSFSDIIAGILAGIIFVLFYFVIKAGIVVSLVVGVLAYIGSLFIFNKKETEIEFVVDGVTKEYVEQLIKNGKKQVLRIRNLNKNIDKASVKDEVLSICNTADAIFENFENDPKDVKAARKFLNYYLDTTEKILNKYVDIKSKKVNSQEIDATLKKVEDMLQLINETFEKQMKKLLEDDILDLDVELSLLERTIKSEGI